MNSDFIYFVISGAVLMSLVVFLMSFLLGGLLGKFMKVKASRGKKVLVKVRNQIQDYFAVGRIDEGFLVFKDRQKQQRRIVMQPGCVYRAASLFWLDVDDEKNTLFKRTTNDEVKGFDAVKFDNFIKRALEMPQSFGDKQLKIILILVLVAAAAAAFTGFMVYKQGETITQILQIVQGAGVGVVS